MRPGAGVKGGLQASGSRVGSRGALRAKKPVTTRKTGRHSRLKRERRDTEGLRASIITSRRKSVAGAPYKLMEQHGALSGNEFLTCVLAPSGPQPTLALVLLWGLGCQGWAPT